MRLPRSFRFQFMNDDFVSVRILDYGHPANGTFNSLRGESYVGRLQVAYSLLKIFHFNRHAGAVCGRLPLIADAPDRNRVGPEFVFNPNALAILARDFESEHAFVESTRALDVGNWNSGEGDVGSFHFIL